jgi:hypothetical protein
MNKSEVGDMSLYKKSFERNLKEGFVNFFFNIPATHLLYYLLPSSISMDQPF